MNRQIWLLLQAAAVGGGIWAGVAIFRAVTG
jgi:NO-binding membrane sensor protein with MHYT domain